MRHLFTIMLLFAFGLKAQHCDSLSNEGVSHGVSLKTLEMLSEVNCDEAKLSLAYELLHGYRIEKDTIRAIELMNSCQETDIDCKFGLFEVYYYAESQKAYKLITELALIDTFEYYWDSASVFNARVISAFMVMENLGNDEDLSKAATWWILAYEIKDGWYDYPVESILEDMYLFLNKLTQKQFNKAFKEAEKILGHKPIFQRQELK